VGPAYLPEWFTDIDRLDAIVTHSITMNRFNLPTVSRYYERRRRGARDRQLPLLPEEGTEEEEGRPGAPARGEGDAER
ncbi:MAG TPA: DUF1704 domain-containing protein, partial [Anaeromyxobacteraceae bacterium]|nr:DUF1704 domain-containing protein [Anaeromyxobacteraceae bacterium]